MSEAADKDSKTEEPTEKKIRDTIEQGKLPHSREAAMLLSFVAVLTFTVFFANQTIAKGTYFLREFLDRPEAWRLGTAEDAMQLYRVVFVEVGDLVGVFVLLLMVAGIAASILQNMPQFVAERIRPQASRISIMAGWNRMFGAAGWVEFGKSLAKLVFVFAVLSFAAGSVRDKIMAGVLTNPAEFGLVIREVLIRILVSITLVVTAITVFDLFWSRFHWRQDIRMTKQEVKDEHKQAEGDPIVKSRLRSLARDRARRRMITAVPKATLVIANPTHFSIALKYDRNVDAAPIVVAKGQDLLALRIREIAAEHGIPVFEDVALARSMYKQVSVDSVIPAQFYQAVAELVRVVYARQNKVPQRREMQ
ncbi:MAG: flagellar biosynthesis protein FlhB [Rhizobiales bacterium]|nr:flagellar biosynthesis protein FlhB [Hyphomicrobiales bacterium]